MPTEDFGRGGPAVGGSSQGLARAAGAHKGAQRLAGAHRSSQGGTAAGGSSPGGPAVGGLTNYERSGDNFGIPRIPKLVNFGILGIFGIRVGQYWGIGWVPNRPEKRPRIDSKPAGNQLKLKVNYK